MQLSPAGTVARWRQVEPLARGDLPTLGPLDVGPLDDWRQVAPETASFGAIETEFPRICGPPINGCIEAVTSSRKHKA